MLEIERIRSFASSHLSGEREQRCSYRRRCSVSSFTIFDGAIEETATEEEEAEAEEGTKETEEEEKKK